MITVLIVTIAIINTRSLYILLLRITTLLREWWWWCGKKKNRGTFVAHSFIPIILLKILIIMFVLLRDLNSIVT